MGGNGHVERIDSRHFVGRPDRGVARRTSRQGHWIRPDCGHLYRHHRRPHRQLAVAAVGIHLGAGIVSSIIVATIGAVILLVILRLVNRGGRW
jgi:transglycosylase associated protein